MNKTRCAWSVKNKMDQDYHDAEWGVPIYDDRKLFEFLILEGAQAGLSWTVILSKRENYRSAFDNFEPEVIIHYDQDKLDALKLDAGIVRNKLKIKSVVTNAHAYLEVQKEFGSFSKYIWSFVDGKSIQNNWASVEDVPAKTELSDKMSKDLKKRGFKFIGSTICYAYMQAVGMVNDHTNDCYRYEEVKG